MTKKTRVLTMLLAAVMALVMLSSAAYIAAESHHDCTGEDCAICHQIKACEELLKGIGLAAAAAVMAAVSYTLCDADVSHDEAAHGVTLVSLKVKLSD